MNSTENWLCSFFLSHPGSMWEAGVGVLDIGASDQTQKRQGSLLSGLARLFVSVSSLAVNTTARLQTDESGDYTSE
jgi:hypothetical protein